MTYKSYVHKVKFIEDKERKKGCPLVEVSDAEEEPTDILHGGEAVMKDGKLYAVTYEEYKPKGDYRSAWGERKSHDDRSWEQKGGGKPMESKCVECKGGYCEECEVEE